MSYSEQLDALAEWTADAVAGLTEQLDADELDADEWASLAAVLVATAAAQARQLAELSLTGQLIALGLPDPLPTTGAAVALPDLDGIRAELLDALGSERFPSRRDERIRAAAREPALDTARETYGEAVRDRPEITGWYRQLNADACELCQWWNREDRVWPKKHPMPTHKGCLCAPAVVAQEYIMPVGRRGRARARSLL